MWIVAVHETGNVYQFMATMDGQRRRDVVCTVPFKKKEWSVERDNYMTSNLFFAPSEEAAIALAKGVAKFYPTMDVFVSEVRRSFSTSEPDVVEKNVTKKGVLPA